MSNPCNSCPPDDQLQCDSCPYYTESQTDIYTITLSDHQFQMLEWALNCEINFWYASLKKSLADGNDQEIFTLSVITSYLSNFDNILKNSKKGAQNDKNKVF